jgi:hypothetical protein
MRRSIGTLTGTRAPSVIGFAQVSCPDELLPNWTLRPKAAPPDTPARLEESPLVSCPGSARETRAPQRLRAKRSNG